MSWKIQIYRAKPNPTGKDKVKNHPIPSQLLAEWVDLSNVGDTGVKFSTLNLAHSEFAPGCQIKPNPTLYWKGDSDLVLMPNQIVRVHTGYYSQSHLMHPDDKSGVHYHAFAERGNFVLNNDCGDVISVWWKSANEWHRDDYAGYASNPPEGQILYRNGDKLVPMRRSILA